MWVAAIGPLPACAGRVPVLLAAPSAEAPRRERVQAYCRLRPVARDDGRVIDWAGSDGLAPGRGVRLGDGTWVEDPHDLVAVLPPMSESALAVRKIDDLDTDGTALLWGGIGLATVSLGGITHAVLTDAEDGARAGWAIAGGIAAVLITSALRLRLANTENRVTAFDTYEAGLRERLALDADADGPGLCGPGAPESVVNRR